MTSPFVVKMFTAERQRSSVSVLIPSNIFISGDTWMEAPVCKATTVYISKMLFDQGLAGLT